MGEVERLYESSLAFVRAGNLSQGIQQLERLIKDRPDYADAIEALGICYEKAKRMDDAILMMKRLTQLEPNHIMAHSNLSRFYLDKGMILEAEQEQAEARRLSWKAELKSQKQQSGERRKEKNAKEIELEKINEVKKRIERYKKVVQLDSKDVLGYFSLGSAYQELRELDLARHAFEKAIHVDSEHSSSFFCLGITLESLGKKDEAAQIYKKGIQVADRRGDMIPLKKMQARLSSLCALDQKK
jgi:tetratricopeptide (TPR) repeat protein